jgi:hypothetical protein
MALPSGEGGGSIVSDIQIPLTQGKYALIDADDLPVVSAYRWHLSVTKSGLMYAAASQGRAKKIYMHRLLMNAPHGVMVDHRNGDSLDNTRANMRLCTNAENQRNARRRKGQNTMPTGVRWESRKGRWIVIVRVDSYETEEEAVAASLKAKEYFYGDFAPQFD